MPDTGPSYPVLYSLQNCPYAIRARFAISRAKKPVLLRAIKLNNKPQAMLLVSPKGTVPVLVFDDDSVIEESIGIMRWAFSDHTLSDLITHQSPDVVNNMLAIIADFETQFIPALEAYCCAKRYHEDNLIECRARCELTLIKLETRLSGQRFLYGQKESIVDIALFPFLRKFARVERQWYLKSPYPKLREWLNDYLQSPMFSKVMTKHDCWLDNPQQIIFGC